MISSDQLYCRQVATQSGSNFLQAFRLLPPLKQNALFAFYALCRTIDDIVDSDHPLEVKTQELTQWRQDCLAGFQGQAKERINRELARYIEPCLIEARYIEDIFDGVAMDLHQTRYPTFTELYRYCYGVAGAVGIVSSRIFGCRSELSRQFAETLGIAFQLTNILRDIASDLKRDRIYIPQEDLARFGVTEDQLRSGKSSPELQNLLQFQYERAAQFYQRANQLIPTAERRCLLPARLMAAYYKAILETLARKDFAVFAEKISLPRWYKAGMFALYWPQFLWNRLLEGSEA